MNAEVELTFLLGCFDVGQQDARRLDQLQVDSPIVHREHLCKVVEAVLLDHSLQEGLAVLL